MKRITHSLLLSSLLLSSSLAAAKGLDISFTNPSWTGKKIPEGQQCTKDGGKGSTPGMKITNIPEGTAILVAQFNDSSYKPLSRNGGHGSIGFTHKGGSEAVLPSVPGETDEGFPDGSFLVKGNRAFGAWKSLGYLPPCSGGRGNKYTVEIYAVDQDGKRLAKGKKQIAKY